ncbi:uncharacterized protein zgc:113229 [Xyrichtys novacula]|uniref:Uncharacterized protein zgc:113229 n=1 Tax=Xyrichtys novacula TaxID=13765 RepID=A0AAV1FBK6_XYRNO|nr:uncharacterized protein zgc:113229 [Xyrichtys novacula]
MSQPRNSSDSQALLQSMLQKLKLQPGREGQVYLHSPLPNTAAPTWGQDGDRGTSDPQGVKSSPVNGFESSTKGFSSQDFGISAAKMQQPDRASEGHGYRFSFPTQKDNTDSKTGENRVTGQTTKIPKGREQLLPAVSLKDVGISSSGRTDEERGSLGSSAMTSHTPDDKDAETSTGQSQEPGQGFTPRVYSWSLKPADGNIDTGSQAGEVLHMGNGGFGAKDLQVSPTGKTNSLSRRQQRTTGNKTRRWTQKIKEKWRDRQGSFGKKGKEEGAGNNQQGSGVLSENQLITPEILINTSNKEEGRMTPSLNSSDSSETPAAHTDESDGYMRSTGDFEFGLGSFSLLEEIVTGQEWAKFLNPNLPSPLTSQRPSEKLQTTQLHHDSVDSNPHGANKLNLMGAEARPCSVVSMGQTSPDVFLPVSMDVSGGKQQLDVHREADHSEPMEHGHNQSDMQSEESGQQQRPSLFLRPIDLLDNSALKSRVQLNRKRQHQSAVRTDPRLQTSPGKATATEGSMTPNREITNKTGEESQHDVQPLYSLKSAQPLSPSSAPPKGVLKHSISRESESSMEVESKRRRVEENRRVRFSEEVQAIPPLEMDLDDSDEEDSEAEEDSVISEEFEAERVVMEEVVHARRPALPAWILALKKMNSGKKHK